MCKDQMQHLVGSPDCFTLWPQNYCHSWSPQSTCLPSLSPDQWHAYMSLISNYFDSMPDVPLVQMQPDQPTQHCDAAHILSVYFFPRLLGGGPGSASDLSDGSAFEPDDEDSMMPPMFILGDWIGRGIAWTDNMPKDVRQARNHACHIPPAIRSLFIPASHLSVRDLLDQFPDNISPGLPNRSTKYSTNLPSVDISTSCIMTHHTIFSSVLSSLSTIHVGFDTSWLSSHNSIEIWRNN